MDVMKEEIKDEYVLISKKSFCMRNKNFIWQIMN